MLSYRHAFHAGNHADVLKHFILLQLLDYYGRKDKTYWYIDTHAGAGIYSLTEGYATQNAEYVDGIGRLLQASGRPAGLAAYVEAIEAVNDNGPLQFYPGSPWLAWHAMRETDKLRLFELHPSDYALLAENFADCHRQVKIDKANGFDGLKALLPPPTRRAVVLIDPPYEDKNDYARVVSCLQDALKRFATGCYAIWYPLLQRNESRQLADKLKLAAGNNWLDVSLTVHAPRADGFGMHGSGMFIVNPPYTLPQQLQQIMPELVRLLGLDNGAAYHLESRID